MAEERRRPMRLESALLGVTFGAKGLLLLVVAEVTPIRAVASAIFMVGVVVV